MEKVATKDDLLGVDDSSKNKDILLLRHVKFGKSHKISTWFLGEWILAPAKCEKIESQKFDEIVMKFTLKL